MNKKVVITIIFLIGAALIPVSFGEQLTIEDQLSQSETTNQNLTAEIEGPSTGYVNEEVEFHANAQGGKKPYTYEWDFGDGTETIILETPTHSYSSIGTYTINLTVTDSALYEEQEVKTTATIEIIDENKKPEISVLKPENALYINNKELFGLNNPVIIGNITVEADASDDESGLKNVTFSLNGEFQEEVVLPPYEWTWDTIGFGRYSLSVTAYDNTGNKQTKDLSILKIL